MSLFVHVVNKTYIKITVQFIPNSDPKKICHKYILYAAVSLHIKSIHSVISTNNYFPSTMLTLINPHTLTHPLACPLLLQWKGIKINTRNL